MLRTLLLVFSILATTLDAAPWSSHGPLHGTIRDFAIAHPDSSILFAVAPDGVFRSQDGGASWTNITGPIVNPIAVEVRRDDPRVVIVAASSGVHRSADGGTSWQQADGIPAGLLPRNLLVDPRDANIVYTASGCRQIPGGGVFKSTDGGMTFSSIGLGLGEYQRCVDSVLLDPLAPDRLYLAWSHQDIGGVARSEDGGVHWDSALPSITPERGRIVALPDGRRYAIGSAGYALLTSTDGVRWDRVTIEAGIEDGPVLATHFTDLSVDPSSGRLFLGATNGAYRSGNGGVHWLRLEGAARDWIRKVHYDVAASRTFLATDAGLFRSEAFPWNDWIRLPVGNSSMPMRQVTAGPNSSVLHATAARHVFRSSDFGASWAPWGEPHPSPFSVLAVDAGNHVYASDLRQGWYHILELGSAGRWEEKRTTGTFGGLVPDPHEPGTLYSLELESLARTRDGGATWERLQLPQHATAWSLVIDPRNTDRLLISTFRGIFTSDDGGRAWIAAPPAPFSAMFWVVASASQPDLLYASVRDLELNPPVLARSFDRGTSWTLLPSQPAPDGCFGIVAVHPRDPETLYLATCNHGVQQSVNGGATWEAIGEGLPDGGVSSLFVDPAGAFLHVATAKRGMWRLPLTRRRRSARSHSLGPH